MLVGLVDGHRAPGSRERPGFDLAHGRVDEVPGLVSGTCAERTAPAAPAIVTAIVAAHVGEVKGRPQAQGRREAGVGFERQDVARLHAVCHAKADTSPISEVAQGPATAQALRADLLAGLQGQAREGRPGGRRHGIEASDR